MILDAYDKIHPILKPVKGLWGQLSCVAPTPVDDALDADSPHPVQNAVVTAALNEKVDAIDGKSLSSNDFTDAYKAKLDGIEAQANKTVVDALFVANSTNPVQSKTIKLALDGKVDKEDGKVLSDYNFTSGLKAKLEGIEAGATKTIIDTSMSASSPNAVSNAAVCAALENKVSVVPGKGLSSNDFTDELKTKLENIDPSSGGGSVNDVTVAGTSVLDGDTAKIPKASSSAWGAVKVSALGEPPTLRLKIEANVIEGTSAVYVPRLNSNTQIPVDLLPAASTTVKGAMSAADKAKLDGIQSGATAVTVDSALNAQSSNPVQNSVLTEALNVRLDMTGGTEFEASQDLDSILTGTYFSKTWNVIKTLLHLPVTPALSQNYKGVNVWSFGVLDDLVMLCWVALQDVATLVEKDEMYVRYSTAHTGSTPVSPTWGAWQKIPFASDIPEQSVYFVTESNTSAEVEAAYQTGKAVFYTDATNGKVIAVLGHRASATKHYFFGLEEDSNNTDIMHSCVICENDVWELIRFPFSPDADYIGAIPAPSSHSDGDVLTWDETEGAWVAAAPTGGGGGVLGVTQDQDGYLVLSPVSAVTEEDVSDTGAVTAALDPNVLYHFTGAITSLTITLNTPQTGMIAHYHFDFTSGSTAATLTLPQTVVMPSGFSVAANTRYEVDILNNYGTVMSWAISS